MPAVCRVHPDDITLNSSHSCRNCRKCAHVVQGAGVLGSSTVFIEGYAALCQGDPGRHKSCCGKNEWIASSKAVPPYVFVDDKPLFCVGDITLHDQKDVGIMQHGSDFVSIE